MSRPQAGAALAETALVVGLALLVIFNALELAMLGFYQLHADAVAFLSARVQSLADATTAQSTVASALPPAPASGPVLTSPSGQSQSIVTQLWQGFLLLPQSAGSTVVTGEYIEPTASQATINAPFAFAVPNATLPNYYPQGDVNDPNVPYSPAYTIVYLAQNLGSGNGNGNGWNGRFDEWREHAQCFAAVGFPNSYSSTQSATTPSGYVVDPKTNPWSVFPKNSAEATIYGWDRGGSGTC